MIISIVNRSKRIKDSDLQAVHPRHQSADRLRLSALLELWCHAAARRPDRAAAQQDGAARAARRWPSSTCGDHTDVDRRRWATTATNARGIPYGFVFTDLAEQTGRELDGDACRTRCSNCWAIRRANLLVQGAAPPSILSWRCFHWFEMCDAVQSQTYIVDGVEVANFLLPLYFTTEEQEGGRKRTSSATLDKKGKPLESFGIADGRLHRLLQTRATRFARPRCPSPVMPKRPSGLKIKGAATNSAAAAFCGGQSTQVQPREFTQQEPARRHRPAAAFVHSRRRTPSSTWWC